MSNVQHVHGLFADREQKTVRAVDQQSDLELGTALWRERTPLGKPVQRLSGFQQALAPLGRPIWRVFADAEIDFFEVGVASAVISTFIPAAQLVDRFGEWTGPPGLHILQPAADPFEGFGPVHRLEELLVRGCVLNHNLSAAVHRQNLRLAGLFQPFEVSFRIPLEIRQRVDLFQVNHVANPFISSELSANSMMPRTALGRQRASSDGGDWIFVRPEAAAGCQRHQRFTGTSRFSSSAQFCTTTRLGAAAV